MPTAEHATHAPPFSLRRDCTLSARYVAVHRAQRKSSAGATPASGAPVSESCNCSGSKTGLNLMIASITKPVENFLTKVFRAVADLRKKSLKPALAVVFGYFGFGFCARNSAFARVLVGVESHGRVASKEVRI
ncbi:protein of unknown function (plasmid) [Paraburkholderia dioscoreae]|uniref:Uncharacterized protein n=1 Tax=Paraburkholderia dioscoreae TaxID=2604047 RepID=A0A5Q4ZQQ0_9BURK|nr:protein of unknown function [Paraburkholderia dioscoreae]